MPGIPKANQRWNQEEGSPRKGPESKGEAGVAQIPREKGRERFPCLCSQVGLHSLCDENLAPLQTQNSKEIVSEKQGWGPWSFPLKTASGESPEIRVIIFFYTTIRYAVRL